MKSVLPILLVLLPLGLCAQNAPAYNLEYGKVSRHELLEAAYPLDTAAEAAVIFDFGDYRFVPYETGIYKGLLLRMTFTRKIKIYNDAGLTYAEIEIPYYNPSHNPEVIEIEGATYNFENGGITGTTLTRNNIYTEQVRGDHYIKKAAFPNVRAGSIIELRYTIETNYFFNMRTWWFQQKIPVYRSLLKYYATPFYTYAFVARGLTKFDERSSSSPTNLESRFDRFAYQEVEHLFAMNRMPAFRDEEFMLNTDDYMANVNFQLAEYLSFDTGNKVEVMSSWMKMNDELLKDPNFGKYVDDAAKAADKLLAPLGLAGKSDLEKFEAICNYVKVGYVWDRYVSKSARKKLSAFLKEKTGNSAEINLFMAGLMRAAGLEAHPVALGTNDNGIINKNYPFDHYLNDVVAMATIDGENYFADATTSLTRYDELPRRSSNAEGMIIRKGDPGWVTLSQREQAANTRTVRMTISPAEGILSAESVQSLTGYQAYRLRSIYNGDIEKLRERYKGNEGMSIRNIETGNFQETGKPFVIKMNYDIRWGAAGNEPEQIIFNPLLYLAPPESPFKQTRRSHPVNLIFKSVDNFRLEIEIPEGYAVEYLPEEFIQKNDIMQIVYRPSADGNVIRINAGYAMKDLYQAWEYAELKSMFEKMVRTFSEVIILKKK